MKYNVNYTTNCLLFLDSYRQLREYRQLRHAGTMADADNSAVSSVFISGEKSTEGVCRYIFLEICHKEIRKCISSLGRKKQK
jgi:hypothetical protein